jgi:hypothetical protein
VGSQRAARRRQTGLATHPLYKFSGFAGYGWLALVAVAMLLAGYAGFAKISAAQWCTRVGRSAGRRAH